ncbi:zinc finger protein 431-like [Meriones unguiculatus]|uniref:zinc finger protein 431-like n=1 Tax=Meriones unguiculatus TaxID=10047 RepID=UPI00293EE447|nr:zinc finger protein 431-like [Meriones unguiculatus]
MLETYRNLTAIGYNWESHNIEEHCQSPKRHTRYENNHCADKLPEDTQDEVFAHHNSPHTCKSMHTGVDHYECCQYGNAFAHKSHPKT